ncbi:MAG TPA: triple tyrosine motif-containing protein [Arachidicoccus sp.]|nr:triple tyrosine motif-containing protein [Arachidicoccus sp.]
MAVCRSRLSTVFIKIALTIILLFSIQESQSQNTIGLPNVTNFTQQDFKAGVQNWMITQDALGIMYFANTDGLLTYNGNDWKIFPLPNKTLVRSLAISPDGKIYAGGQDELGYYFPSRNGTLQYHSLKSRLPLKDRSFADVWNVYLLGKQIFFRCTDRIFVYDTAGDDKANLKLKVKVYQAPSEWSFMGKAGGLILAQDKKEGLLYFTAGSWKLLTAGFNGKTITAALTAGKDSVLITTLKDGVFLYHHNRLERIGIKEGVNHAHIYTAIGISKNEFALGTTSDGAYIINLKGQIIRHFTSATRLQNNNVLSLFVDKESNLWLGLDKGIDLLDYNSFIQTISPVSNTPAACYTASIFQGQLFIGTSDGLYQTPLNKTIHQDLSFSTNTFTRVAGSGGQVWGLFPTTRHLLMGHNEGIYQIEHHRAVPVFKDEGVWLFNYLPGSPAKDQIITGNYAGMNLLKEAGGKVTDAGRVPGSPYESLRFMAIDSIHHIIWSSHPYRGIYKLQMSPDMRRVLHTTLYTEKQGLPGRLNNYVYTLAGEIVICTNQGIYVYDQTKDRFIPSATYQKIFGKMVLRMVVEDSSHNIWFVTQKKLGVALHNKGIQYFPELTGKLISGFEFIFPLNGQNIFVGSNDGLIHINFEKYQQKRGQARLLLSKVVAISNRDSVLFNGYFTDKSQILTRQSSAGIFHLPARFNSFHFEYTTTVYRQPSDFRYAFQLVGFDKDWSAWSEKKEKDYTNLSYGKYIFRVKTRDRFGKESKVLEYTFVIEPHWYQTNLAYSVYGIVVILFLIFLHKWQLRKFDAQKEKYEKEQQQLQYLHQLEIEHSEREIIQLQKEKLEAEVAFKNQELASTTMHLFKRGKVLSKLKEELMTVVKKMPVREQKSEFSKLIKMLNEAEKQDNDWEQFSIHFDEVHNNFLTNLKHTYPDLTQSDLKICAYLKMNLSSKEIAQLLNISLKGVEVARYRLRKKLNIPSSQINLYDFLVEKLE